jgi:hypothetical protein
LRKTVLERRKILKWRIIAVMIGIGFKWFNIKHKGKTLSFNGGKKFL